MQLKIETLQTADEYIDRLQTGITQLVEYYRYNQIDQGSLLMVEVIDGLRWVVEVLENTQDILTNVIDITEIKGILRNIIDTLEQKDDVLLADLFEYEVQEILENYQQEIKTTIQHRMAH